MYLNTELMTLPLACSSSHLHTHTAHVLCDLTFYPLFWINSTYLNSQNLIAFEFSCQQWTGVAINLAWSERMKSFWSISGRTCVTVFFHSFSSNWKKKTTTTKNNKTCCFTLTDTAMTFCLPVTYSQVTRDWSEEQKHVSVFVGSITPSGTQRNQVEINLTFLFQDFRHNAHNSSETATCGI